MDYTTGNVLAIGAEHAVKIGVGVPLMKKQRFVNSACQFQVCFEYLALFVWRGIISVKVETRFANGYNFWIGQQGLGRRSKSAFVTFSDTCG